MVLKYNILWCAGLLIIQTSCLYNISSRYKNEPQLLYKQTFTGFKNTSRFKLESLVLQKPNQRFLNLPISPKLFVHNIASEVYLENFEADSLRKLQRLQNLEERAQTCKTNFEDHQANHTAFNKQYYRLKKEYHNSYVKLRQKWQRFERFLEKGNWGMVTLGEAPVFFSLEKTKRSAQILQNYLRENGYFQAQTYFTLDTVKSIIKVNYFAELNLAYKIRRIKYHNVASDILAIIEADSSRAPLQTKAIYRQDLVKAQRRYLVNLLRDEGYYYMTEAPISFVVDTLIGNQELDLQITFAAASEPKLYQKQHIQQVDFIYDEGSQTDLKDTAEEAGIHFYNWRSNYKPKIIAPKISIRPYNYYDNSINSKVQLSLSDLNIFKYIHLSYESIDDTTLNSKIFVRFSKRYQYTLEAGVNALGLNVPGPFLRFILGIRNFLGSLNTFQFTNSISLESQGSVLEQNTDVIYNSLFWTTRLTLKIPKILFPLPTKLNSRLLSSNVNTQVEFGLSYTKRPEYARLNIQNTLRYTWNNGLGKQLDFDIFNLNLINTDFVRADFKKRLRDLQTLGNNLISSFDSSLVTSTRLYYKKGNNAKLFSVEFESGGHTYNFFNPESELLQTNKILGLRYYQYLRLTLNYKLIKDFAFSKTNKLILNSLGGLAYTYGKTLSLPYEKNYFTGGSNTNRGWPTRRVGPGAYKPPIVDGKFNYNFEQPGDIILGLNLEYRRTLAGQIDFAYFIDASNIWTFKADLARPGAQFGSDFWREFAISTGLGLRLNLTFFIFRIDMGLRAYNPAFDLERRFVLMENIRNQPLKQAIFNIGIGYPF